MGLTNAQRTALGAEGLTTVNDFVDFEQEELKVAFKNMRTAPAPVSIPARCSTRLIIASVAFHYYRDIGREVTAVNINFINVLRNFNIEWKALNEKKKQDADVQLPVLSKSVPPLKWCESFKHYLYNTFGVRSIPLLYVVREKVDVDPEAPPAGAAPDPTITYDPLQAGKAYGSSGSILEELIKRSSHAHPL